MIFKWFKGSPKIGDFWFLGGVYRNRMSVEKVRKKNRINTHYLLFATLFYGCVVVRMAQNLLPLANNLTLYSRAFRIKTVALFSSSNVIRYFDTRNLEIGLKIIAPSYYK